MPLIEVPQVKDTDAIWNNLDQYRKNHQVLAQLFTDTDKSYALVGKGNNIVERRYHPSADRVDYAIYTKASFVKSQSYYLSRR